MGVRRNTRDLRRQDLVQEPAEGARVSLRHLDEVVLTAGIDEGGYDRCLHVRGQLVRHALLAAGAGALALFPGGVRFASFFFSTQHARTKAIAALQSAEERDVGLGSLSVKLERHDQARF